MELCLSLVSIQLLFENECSVRPAWSAIQWDKGRSAARTGRGAKMRVCSADANTSESMASPAPGHGSGGGAVRGREPCGRRCRRRRGALALRSITVEQAEKETREQVQLQGALVEAAGLSDGVLTGRLPRSPVSKHSCLVASSTTP